MLRSGKVAGIIAACLLMLQLVWSARIKWLDRIFALNNLYTIHAVSGIFIACVLVVHAVLILQSDDMLFIPLQLRYWPEFAGFFLLVVVFGMVAASRFRAVLHLPFNLWWVMHRLAAAVVPVLLFIHVLFVSETFESGLPRQLVFLAIAAYLLLYTWVKTRIFRLRSKPFEITAVEKAGEGAYSVQMKPQHPAAKGRLHSTSPCYLPGQFGFIKIKSPHISGEEHPFTIASSPSVPAGLEFIIRTSGDWTSGINKARPGDRAFVDGPFGLFTHFRVSPGTELIMIAGGIGITPMLSMLRYMRDTGDKRRITLIWSNRTRDHIIWPDEINSLQPSLPDLRVFHVITDETGRLDQARIADLLSGCGFKAAVFVCGPPAMMKDMTEALAGMDYSRRLIFTERFSL
ncbi:MAG: ferric reductase-like transmembrane domain-containing protein [Desulfosalsimonas sp.]